MPLLRKKTSLMIYRGPKSNTFFETIEFFTRGPTPIKILKLDHKSGVK